MKEEKQIDSRQAGSGSKNEKESRQTASSFLGCFFFFSPGFWIDAAQNKYNRKEKVRSQSATITGREE